MGENQGFNRRELFKEVFETLPNKATWIITLPTPPATSIIDSSMPIRESNFSLVFRYGAGWEMTGSKTTSGKFNELNTLNNSFTKDMISAPSITVKLSLSEEDLDSIYQKMQEIDFNTYPAEFSVVIPPGTNTTLVMPSEKYYFKVVNGSQVKELYWDDIIRNEDIQAIKLRGLIQLIKSIIVSKEAYKTLPPPSGGYQ